MSILGPSGFLNNNRTEQQPDPYPSRKVEHNTQSTASKLTMTMGKAIPLLKFSFGVDKNDAIQAFFQQYEGTDMQYQVIPLVNWINEEMPSEKADQMIFTLSKMIAKEIEANPVRKKKLEAIERTIKQHRLKSAPIDDRWDTLELHRGPKDHVRIEVVKNNHYSWAFLHQVVGNGLKLGVNETFYVIHLDNIPSTDPVELQEHYTNNSYSWVKETLTQLNQKHDNPRYIVACSPRVGLFFDKSHSHPLRSEHQENTRVYRDIVAAGNIHPEEAAQLEIALTLTDDINEKERLQKELEEYKRHVWFFKNKHTISLSIAPVSQFLV